MILVKFMIYIVLPQFPTWRNLLAFSLPSTWSSSILPSPPLPLKSILTLWLTLSHTLKVTFSQRLPTDQRTDRPTTRLLELLWAAKN